MKNFITNYKKTILVALAFVFIIGTAGVIRAATSVGLLTAGNFAVLAGSGITNTGATTITGDIGTFPTTTQIGFGTISLTGTNHVGNAVTVQAKADLVTAYNNALGQPVDVFGVVSADLGGQTLAPGVYEDNGAPNSLGIANGTTLTLDGGGDPNAIFILKSASTLVTGVNSTVALIGSAQACNVFWQVGSSATLGVGSTFVGNILAFSSITDNGGSTINGRLLARNAAVTLNNTTVIRSTCAGALPGTLNVIKHVVNDNGGTSTAGNFTLTVSGTTNITPASFVGSESGTAVSLDAGSYSVTEGAYAGYTTTYSTDCTGLITEGATKTCTVTNDDILVQRGGGGGMLITPPTVTQTVPVIVPVVQQIVPVVLPIAKTVTPKLPNTGFPPQDSNSTNTKNIAGIVAILGAVSAIYFLQKRKVSTQ